MTWGFRYLRFVCSLCCRFPLAPMVWCSACAASVRTDSTAIRPLVSRARANLLHFISIIHSVVTGYVGHINMIISNTSLW
jgi:hypothetical protein